MGGLFEGSSVQCFVSFMAMPGLTVFQGNTTFLHVSDFQKVIFFCSCRACMLAHVSDSDAMVNDAHIGENVTKEE